MVFRLTETEHISNDKIKRVNQVAWKVEK